MSLFDTHAHLTMLTHSSLDQILERAKYSLLRTWSKASLRWRRTWNLSNNTWACGAWAALKVDVRNGFHISITPSESAGSFGAPATHRTDPYLLPSDPSPQTRWPAGIPGRSRQCDTCAPCEWQSHPRQCSLVPASRSAAVAPACTVCPTPSPSASPAALPCDVLDRRRAAPADTGGCCEARG